MPDGIRIFFKNSLRHPACSIDMERNISYDLKCINNVSTRKEEVIPILSLNHRDARPLHEQVREGIRQLIIGGAMSEEERLPAVRELAANLAINPNTIARAYRDLEGEGYVHSVSGVGTFVSPRGDVGARRKELLLPQWEKITAELLYLGESIDALAERMRAMPSPSAAAREGGLA